MPQSVTCKSTHSSSNENSTCGWFLSLPRYSCWLFPTVSKLTTIICSETEAKLLAKEAKKAHSVIMPKATRIFRGMN